MGAPQQVLLARSGVQTQIPDGTGTVIGNMVDQGGNAAAFNGNTNVGFTACAALGNVDPTTTKIYVGKDWGVGNTKALSGFQCWPANDRGFGTTGSSPEGNTTLFLEGSTTGAWAGEEAILYTDGPFANSTSSRSNLSGVTFGNYRYHRVRYYNNTASASFATYAAEVRFFETI